MKTSLTLLLALLGLLGGAALPQISPTSLGTHYRSAKDRHAELKRALKGLEKVREDLMKASRDYGGHRTKAVEAIDTAIGEVKQALAFSG
jgi:hypothetical protein